MKLIYTLILICLTGSVFAQTPPTANFTANQTTVCLGQPVLFTSTSTQGSSAITNYAYDFGDGNAASTANASHTYAVAGTYTVTLVVQAANGQADPEVKVNYITVNPTPTANYTASTNGCSLPVGVTFTNTSSGATSYNWSFGNSQTSTVQNPPMVNYTTAGTYTVSLIATNSFGCKDTLSQPIVISNYQAGITAPLTGCANTPVSIQDNSTIGANQWSWSFPGGSPASSSSEDNSVTYSTPGTYTINLTSNNTGSGCQGTATAQITINPLPTPSFTNTPTTGCAPLPVTFTNTSGAGTFSWNFGDGSPVFNGQNPPVHTYGTNGNYTVTLTMTNANGCVGTYSTVAVNMTAPNAAFTSDVVDGCDPLSVQFTDGSTASSPITSWQWNFGDGTTFNGQNPPTHVYPIGVYDVTLIISAGGCNDTITMDQYIQVGHVDLVNFSIATSPQCAKTGINFTNLSQILTPHNPSEVTYLWDFGDGSTSTLENPTHSYTSDTGYFDISLIVNFRGCRDTLIMNQAVYIKAPISLFSPAQSLFCNQTLPIVATVNDNSKIGKIPDDCAMVWSWGDGSFTNFDDPDFDDADKGTTTHTYTAEGTYTIQQLIINYTTGCRDSTTATVYVSHTDAVISPPANDSVCVGSSFTLNGSNSSATPVHMPMASYSWNMGNGQTVTGATPSYAYPSFGTFTITLTATNAVGCSDNATYAPFVALALPNAVITADDPTGCAPHLVTFSNGSTLQNNGVPLSSFLFTFTDNGATQTTTNVATTVTHTYTTEGTFTATLVVTDQFGCVSPAASTTITITKPVSGFTLDPVVCNLENFVASNTSTGVAPLTYQWFVDGTQISTSQDFPNSHNEPSSNSVSSWQHDYTLITTDANGCKDTSSNTLVVSTPVAIIDYTLDGAATNANGDFLCPPVFATFTDGSLSYGNVTSYSWVFGDGKTSTLTNPNNTYVFPGTYSVGVTIVDEYGCTSDTTLVDYLTIFGPTATPSWFQDPSICGQFVDFTIGDTSNVTSIVWNLGDGTTYNDSTDFTYGYQDVTTYTPSVTVFDDNGCQVAYPLNPITIPDNGLNAQFAMGPNPADLGNQVTFVDQSTSNSPIVSWTWDLVNIDPFTNPTGANVSSVYVYPGDLTITLVVQDANGCFDTYTSVLHINGDFQMPNVITADGDGVNDVFEFTYPIFQSFNITIVDRWGSVVCKGERLTGKVFWDGTNKGGELVNDGVYFYMLDAILVDGTPLKKDGFLHVYGKK